MKEKSPVEFYSFILRRVSFDANLFVKEWKKAIAALQTASERLALNNFVRTEFPQYYTLVSA